MAEDVCKGHCIMPGCDAVVMVRRDKNGKHYYVCFGNHDDRHRACNSKVHFGPQIWAKISQKMDKVDEATDRPERAGRTGQSDTGTAPERTIEPERSEDSFLA